MEWAYLIVGILAGYLFTILYEFCFDFIHKKTKKEPIVRLYGLHFHHSIYGILLIFVFIITSNLFILGFGLGIIIRHSQDEKKFTFIDKS